MWAIDFQFDSDWKGRVLKVCIVIDEFTRQHLDLRVERRMGAVDVIEMLDLAALAHGAPQVLRADNGPEFIAAAVGRWARGCQSVCVRGLIYKYAVNLSG